MLFVQVKNFVVYSRGKSKNSFWTSTGLGFALLLSINLAGVGDTPGVPHVTATLHMPLGLEVGSSPCPHSLALCHSLWPTPVSISNAFNILYILSKPLSSLTSVFQRSVLSLKSATILWSQPRTELSTWGWWVGSMCAEMWTPSALGTATGWSTCLKQHIPNSSTVPNKCGYFLSVPWQRVGSHCPKACHYLWLYHLWNLDFRHPYFPLCPQTSSTPPTLPSD